MKRTGPTISFMATVATASAPRPAPKAGNSFWTLAEMPRASPAWEMRPAHPQLRRAGTSWAKWLATRLDTKDVAARATANSSATGHRTRSAGKSRWAPATPKKTTYTTSPIDSMEATKGSPCWERFCTTKPAVMKMSSQSKWR